MFNIKEEVEWGFYKIVLVGKRDFMGTKRGKIVKSIRIIGLYYKIVSCNLVK